MAYEGHLQLLPCHTEPYLVISITPENVRIDPNGMWNTVRRTDYRAGQRRKPQNAKHMPPRDVHWCHSLRRGINRKGKELLAEYNCCTQNLTSWYMVFCLMVWIKILKQHNWVSHSYCLPLLRVIPARTGTTITSASVEERRRGQVWKDIYPN